MCASTELRWQSHCNFASGQPTHKFTALKRPTKAKAPKAIKIRFLLFFASHLTWWVEKREATRTKLKLILKIDFYRDLQSSWPFLNAVVDMRVLPCWPPVHFEKKMFCRIFGK